MSYKLNIGKSYSVISKTFLAGVSYSAADLGTFVNDKNDRGEPYFVEEDVPSLLQSVGLEDGGEGGEGGAEGDQEAAAAAAGDAPKSPDLTKEEVGPNAGAPAPEGAPAPSADAPAAADAPKGRTTVKIGKKSDEPKPAADGAGVVTV